MTAHRFNRLRVIECLPFQHDTPGFALPLFAHPINAGLRLIQEVDELRGMIADFKLLDGSITGSIPIGLSGPIARIGEDVVHVFLTADGCPHAGRLAELRPILRAYSEQHPRHTAVILQIQELLGSSEEKKIARTHMRNVILERSGAGAARAFYERSTLSTALWDHLTKLAPNDAVAKRILAARSHLSAKIDSSGAIVFDLSALTTDDRSLLDLIKLQSSLMSEFDVTAIKYDGEEDSTAKNGKVRSEKISKLLEQVRYTGRQEERIAIMADAILRDRETGIAALRRYKRDRARVADWAFQEMRSRLQKDGNRRFDEMMIADLIPRLFTQQYSLTRGELLFYLARHLAKWPIINKAIWHALDRTQSIMVDPFRRQTLKMLGQPKKRS